MTQHRAILTREALIDSAAHEFAIHDYASASVNTIIDTARCTKGALYFHFTSKADLAAAVLGRARTIYTGIVEPWFSDTDVDPIAAVRAMATAVADATHTDTELRAETRLTFEPRYLIDRPSLVWENAAAELFGRADRAGRLGDYLSPQQATRALTTMLAGQRYLSAITPPDAAEHASESFAGVSD